MFITLFNHLNCCKSSMFLIFTVINNANMKFLIYYENCSPFPSAFHITANAITINSAAQIRNTEVIVFHI